MNKPFPTIITTAQDFLWLRLCFVREAESGGDGSVLIASDFTLKALQQLLYNTYGAAHFNKKGRYPLLYFQVLLMSQQFERVRCHCIAILTSPLFLRCRQSTT
jgi:nuclear pore complex protein Nup93